MGILQKLAPEKLHLWTHSDFSLIETPKDVAFPIHEDVPEKLLSIVVYIAPEVNSGTSLYETKEGNGKIDIEWKINPALLFSRKEGITWHSYRGNGQTSRLALVYNLLTTDIKQVFKIEKKSYFFGTK